MSHYRGLDHAGAGVWVRAQLKDVFATGADMVGTQRPTAFPDQVAANAHGDKTRFASMVLGTEGGTGSYGRKTLSIADPAGRFPRCTRSRDFQSAVQSLRRQGR